MTEILSPEMVALALASWSQDGIVLPLVLLVLSVAAMVSDVAPSNVMTEILIPMMAAATLALSSPDSLAPLKVALASEHPFPVEIHC